MDLGEELLRRQKDTRFIFGGLVVLLFICSGIYYFFQKSGNREPWDVADTFLFPLFYFNILLLVACLFILARSFFRLLVDRRNRLLGSRFQTKLVLSAIALSFIPVLILFPFATQLLLDSFEQWFSLPIEDVVVQANETAEALTSQIESTNLRDARRVLEEVESYDLHSPRATSRLLLRMEELREELMLHYLAVYDGTAAIHSIADPRYLRRDISLDHMLREAMAQGKAVRVLEDRPEIEGRLILAARAGTPAAGEPAAGEPAAGEPAAEVSQHTVVVTGTVVPPDIADKVDTLKNAYQTYLRQQVTREPIRTSYLLILLMVTLLVIVAFSSIGLRLARRFTAPIQALAEGTRRISSGDLDHRVEVAVDDEVGVLVDAFNLMAEELQRNRSTIELSNRELLEANKRIRAVLQNVAAGVLSLDAEGRIRTCNGAALGILHQDEKDVIGHPVREVWDDGERGKLLPLLEQEMQPGEVSDHQIRLTAGGVWKTLEVKVTLLPGASGQPGGRVMVLEDLTELIHAQKMATWTEVARRIAHEIKNPLTPIKLTAERLLHKHRQHDPRLGETLEEGVEVIVREVSTLKNMVDEFSRYARMPRPQPREIDLGLFIEKTVSLYEGLKPGVEVATRVDPQAAHTRFDPDQLKSVLTNLLDNAVEWTEAPGTVTVSTARANASLLLNVADTGRGVRDDDKSKLFLPYFSTKGRGTGLGLAIVHRIVEEHHARIRVKDNTPRGTVFTLEIPLQ